MAIQNRGHVQHSKRQAGGGSAANWRRRARAARRAGVTSSTRPADALLGSVPGGFFLPHVGPGGAFCVG